MKKQTTQWIKENLINYLDENNLTIDHPSHTYKKGIMERRGSFKSHYDDYVNDYITTKFHLQGEEEQTKQFFNYLLTKKEGSEEIILEFFKNKSPANKTKTTKENIVEVQDSSDEYHKYQRYITSLLLEDENMLFDYIGNLRFLGSEQKLSFELIKDVFNQEKKEALVEMYLNSNLIKNIEFERRFYEVLSSIELIDKYIDYFPNLKEGKKDFNINDFENKETKCFTITFDNDNLVKQIEVDKNMDAVSSNIDNISNLVHIPELKIENINIISQNKNNKNNKNNKVSKKTVVILGDDLNIDYIKVAITEYMRITLKESEKDFVINKFVTARSNFLEENATWNLELKQSFEQFKDKIKKIYLKEKLDKNLVKEEMIKTKQHKI